MSESKLCFEDLSNDILLKIFDYLYGQHIVFAFCQLNSRFHSLCLHYSNYHIDASDNHTFINKGKFNYLLHFIYSKHIRSLKFSKEQWMPRISTKYLLSLSSLTFIDIKNPTKIKEFLERLSSPHHLHRLSISFKSRFESNIQSMLPTIFKLPNLYQLKWDSYSNILDFDTINQPSFSLRHFSVRCYKRSHFLKLVSCMPNLINLNLLYNALG
jgi:hypothetical protein